MNGDSAMVDGNGGSRRHGESITGKRYAWPDLGGRGGETKEKLTEGKWRSGRRRSGRNVKEVIGGERARRAPTANVFPES